MSPKYFKSRTEDYYSRAAKKHTPRPVWVFDFTERDFCIAPKKYDTERMRRFYWSRAINLFDDYSDYHGGETYELWMHILPYSRGEMIYEQYGYPVYEKIHTNKGFIRVLATYGKCKTIVGKVYTEKEFEKYITSL